MRSSAQAMGTSEYAEPAPLLDRAHLRHQTLDDPDLEQEVLKLFVEQALMVHRTVSDAAPDERRRLAHGLRGSAGGIGAMALAEAATRLEHAGGEGEALAGLVALIDRTLKVIAPLLPDAAAASVELR